MDKLKYIKMENPDGSYTEKIPIAVDATNVNVNDNDLLTVLADKVNEKELNDLVSVVRTKANTDFVNESIDNLENEIQSIASGSPAGVYATYSLLEAADPDHNKIYVITENGHWYYYNNEWTDGGVYQGIEIEDDSISPNKTNFKEDIYYLNEQDIAWEIGNIINQGENGSGNTSIRTPLAKKIFVKKGSRIGIIGQDYSFSVFKFKNTTTASYYDKKLDILENSYYNIDEDCYIRIMISDLKQTVQMDTSLSSYIVLNLLSSTAKNKIEIINEKITNITNDLDILKDDVYYVNIYNTIWELGNIMDNGANGSGNKWVRNNLESKIWAKKGSYVSVNSDIYHFQIFLYETTATASFIKASEVIIGDNPYFIDTDCYIRIKIGYIDERIIEDTTIVNNLITHIFDSTAKDKANKLDTPKEILKGELSWGNTAYKVPNINIYNKSLDFPGDTYVICKNIRYGQFSEVSIDLSAVWAAIGRIIIVFNTSTRTFRALSANNNLDPQYRIVDSIDLKNDYILCSFHFSRKYINSIATYRIDQVEGLTNYTIANQIPEVYYNNIYKINSLIPQYWYTLLENPFYHDVSQMTYEDIYNGYDLLVTNYPNYVSKELLGMDESNTYPIYCYKFFPSMVKTISTGQSSHYTNTEAALENILPTGFISTGLHGSEYPSILALLNLMTLVCNSWTTDEILQYIRFNVNLIIVPIVNPYGYVAKTRGNVNHVDINRNFNTPLWVNGDDSTAHDRYRGISPASEKETQYYQNIIDTNPNLLFHYDIHSLGTSDSTYITKFETQQFVPLDSMIRIGSYIIKGITISGLKNHNMPEKADYIGKIGIGKPVDSNAHAYSSYHYKINSSCPEVLYSYTGQYGDTLNTYDVERLNIEFIANMIICTLNQFINKNGG